MLNETLQALYTACQNRDEKTTKELLTGLNKLGMDLCTVKILLNELIAEGVIK